MIRGAATSVGRLIRGHLYLMVLTAFIIAPLIWVVLLSLKQLPDAYTNRILPNLPLTTEHYVGIFSGALPEVPGAVWNSLYVTAASVLLTTVAATLTGYAVVHLRLRLRLVVIVLTGAALLIPFRVTGIIGLWEVQRALGLMDWAPGLIPAYATLGLPLGIFIMIGIFRTIPHDLMEAAEVDGGNAWWRLWHVGIPLAANGIIVVAVTQFILSWGEYLLAATFTTSFESRTLPLLLISATGGMGAWSWPAIAAVFVTAAIPGIVLFAFVYRRYLDSVLDGSLHG